MSNNWVNPGELNWESLRNEWKSKEAPPGRKRHGKRLVDAETIHRDLTQRRGQMSQSVPLQSLIDILVGIWEDENSLGM